MTLNLNQKLFIIIPLIVGVLAVANITAINLVATTGKDLKRLEAEAQAITVTNLNLGQAIAKDSSLLSLQARASSLGFTSPESVVYLKPGYTVAQR